MKRTALMQLLLRLTMFVLCLGLSVSVASAQTLFSDDFEGVLLPQWVGKGGGVHYGMVVEDPLRPDNHVLTFTTLNSAGDIFGSEVSVTQGQTYILSFEYLGLPGLGGTPDDLGGFIGFGEDTPGSHRWLAGTIFCCGGESDPLIDDGQWHTYNIEFDVFECGLPGQNFCFAVTPPTNNTIQVMLEDFVGSGGIAGDVFFDNVKLIVKAENNPPDCSGAFPNLSVICEPEDRMVCIEILGVTDPDGDPVTLTITGITQDEPVTEDEDDKLCPDGAGVGTSTAQVRVQEEGEDENGRVYEISFKASDGQGGECTGTVKVCVPHDDDLCEEDDDDDDDEPDCIDDGQVFDSTTCPCES